MNLPLTLRKLLTIVCEAELEASIVRDLKALGARGYTITDARGYGAHGTRDAAWPSSANIRIEVLCGEESASAIIAHLEERYYADYGIVSFLVDAQVLRQHKF